MLGDTGANAEQSKQAYLTSLAVVDAAKRNRRCPADLREPKRSSSGYITFGSLNASGSPANSSIGTQLQNTFLSP